MIRAKLSIGIVIAASLMGSTPVVAGPASKLKVSTATATGDAGGSDLCIVRDGKKGRWYQEAAGKWHKCKLGSDGNWNPAKGGGFGGAAPAVAGVAGAGGAVAALAGGGGEDEETPASP